MMCSFQDKDNLYLVLDLYTGGDLRYHICHRKKFTEDQTKFFIACVLLGLEYIHSKNVIHRDIKPENLVCDERGFIAITDFGVAKKNLKDNSSETSGTPGYMAPEVLCAQNHSFPVDFFALGVMGFEFMFGVRPYLGKGRKEIKEAVLSRQAHIHKKDKPIEWTYEAVDFINSMLQRKPMHRLGYGGINEVKEHLWFKEFDWDELYNKKMKSPFQPKMGDNFDKKYCEGGEMIGTETEERYQYYMSKSKYNTLFENYTFICPEAEEIEHKSYYDNNINNNDNNSNSGPRGIGKNISVRKAGTGGGMGMGKISTNNINNRKPLQQSNSTLQITSSLSSNQLYNILNMHKNSGNNSNSNKVISAKSLTQRQYQFPKEAISSREMRSSNSKDSVSRIIVQQQRPLSRLSPSSSSINLGFQYKNYLNHHYSGNSLGVPRNLNKANMVFDMAKIEGKSNRLEREKLIPPLSKNASSILNGNSSYLVNMNYGKYNSNNSSGNKNFSAITKPLYNNVYGGYGNNQKFSSISSGAISGKNYKKSSSMSNFKNGQY